MLIKMDNPTPTNFPHLISVNMDDNGQITQISGIETLELLLKQYKAEELPNAEIPYHYEAEIASGLKYLIEWAKTKQAKS